MASTERYNFCLVRLKKRSGLNFNSQMLVNGFHRVSDSDFSGFAIKTNVRYAK